MLLNSMLTIYSCCLANPKEVSLLNTAAHNGKRRSQLLPLQFTIVSYARSIRYMPSATSRTTLVDDIYFKHIVLLTRYTYRITFIFTNIHVIGKRVWPHVLTTKIVARFAQFLLVSLCFQKSSASEASESVYMRERVKIIIRVKANYIPLFQQF